MKDVENFRLNLRRLLFFHHASAREAARVLGVSEHAVSAWLTGKRRPGLDAVRKITETYDVDSRLLFGDPYRFALLLGVRKRIEAVEAILGTIAPVLEELVEPAPTEQPAVKRKAKRPAKRPASR
jgi:transcriptional regulator with XRE-family HTH domain